MPTAKRPRWPASTSPSQALGYLLARHVPTARLPGGLTLIREAAGFLPQVGLRSRDLGMHPAAVRSWMYAARDHAGLLGPPRGLDKVLAVLDDGVIRSAGRARAVLEAAGAGELSDPRVLDIFAGWCGVEPGFTVLPPILRSPRPAEYVVPHPDDLSHARLVVDTAVRRYGVTSVSHALEWLAENDLRVDAGNDAEALREMLAADGWSGWLWPRGKAATPLTIAMTRFRAFDAPVPLAQVPAAVARASQKRWDPVVGVWPLPTDAIRAWVNARDDCRITADDEVEAVGPRPRMPRHDELIVSILKGRNLQWGELNQALQDCGLSPAMAGLAIYKSPLLRRSRYEGYRLIGR